MASLGLATLDTRVDLGGLDKGLNKAQGRTKKAFSGLGKNLGKIGGAAIVGGIGLAAGAIGGLAFAFRDAASLARTQRDAERQLNAVLESTEHAAGLSADQITNMASGLQEVTNFGDEAIIGGQNLLLTFKNIGADVFPQVTETMLDMSTAMGQDMKQSAIQLGKALNDPTTGMTSLRRVGITFTESQEEQIKTLQESGDLMGAQTIILEELESQFGGSAEAMADPAIQAKNAWGDFKEQIGSVLLIIQGALGKAALPLLQDLMERAQPVIEGVSSAVSRFFDNLDSVLTPLGAAKILLFDLATAFGMGEEKAQGLVDIVGGLVNWVRQTRETIGRLVGPILDTITQFVSWKDVLITLGISIAAFIIPIIASIVSALLPVIATFALVTGAVALLRNSWENNWGGIQEKVRAVIDFVVPLVRGAVDDIRTFWAENGAAIIARVRKAWSQIQVTVNTAIIRVRTIIANVLGAIETFWNQHGTMIIATILTAWTVIQATISSAIAVIRPAITQFVTNAREALASFGPAIEDLKALWDSLKPVIAVVAAVIGAIVLAAVGIAVGALRGLARAVGPVIQAFTGMVSLVANLLRAFVTGLTNTFKIIVALIKGDTDRAKEIWRQNWNETLGIIKQVGQDIKQVIGGLVQAIIGFVSGLVSGVIGFFRTLYNTLVGGSIVVDLVNDIKSFISGMVTAVTEKVSGFVGDVTEFFSGLYDDVTGFVDDLVADVKSAIETTLSQALGNLQGKFETVLGEIEGVITSVKGIWDGFVGAIQEFWNWLKGKVFNFSINLPDVPDWALPGGSPTPLQRAWEDMERSLNRMTIQPTVAPEVLSDIRSDPLLTKAGGGVARIKERNQTNNFTLIQNSNAPTRSSAGEFELMKARVGGI